jgi:hypothetical protein
MVSKHIGFESACGSHFYSDKIVHLCYTTIMYEYTRQ